MKKGISLIVLVITIIVMIILAASVVITLSNTGVIDKASHAVQLTDEKQVQDLAAMVWAEAYLDETKRADIVNVVTQELAKQGVTSDKWDISVSSTGVTVATKSTANLKRINLLNFKYQFEEGMTWGAWIASKYNVDGFYSDGGEVKSGDNKCLTEDGTHAILDSDIIDEGLAYGLVEGPLKY